MKEERCKRGVILGSRFIKGRKKLHLNIHSNLIIVARVGCHPLLDEYKLISILANIHIHTHIHIPLCYLYEIGNLK